MIFNILGNSISIAFSSFWISALDAVSILNNFDLSNHDLISGRWFVKWNEKTLVLKDWEDVTFYRRRMSLTLNALFHLRTRHITDAFVTFISDCCHSPRKRIADWQLLNVKLKRRTGKIIISRFVHMVFNLRVTGLHRVHWERVIWVESCWNM
jgi:hypothetical protein